MTVPLGAIFFVRWSVTGVTRVHVNDSSGERSGRQHGDCAGNLHGRGRNPRRALSPFVFGYAADRVGLQAPLRILAGCGLISGLLAPGLREPAPRLVRPSGAATLGAG